MKNRNHRITTARIGSGWAAIHLADYEDMGWSADVVDTSIGRYETEAEAIIEAKSWSISDELPYVPRLK